MDQILESPEVQEITPDQWRLAAEEEHCRQDRLRRITRHFWIKRADGPISLLAPLKPSQKKVMNLILWLRQHGQPVRIVVLKARKTGISTIIEADMFCEVMDREIDGLVIAHDMETTKYIFNITQMYYERYDLWKPHFKRSSVKELSFTGHKGRVLVTTAGNRMAGTGLTPQYVHSSETPKWQTGQETATSLFQSVADKPGTTVVHEGTAYGYDDLFYPMWKAAYDNSVVEFNEDCTVKRLEVTNPKDWNYYYPLFISVFDDPDCFRPFPDEGTKRHFLQTLDGFEKHLLEVGPATPEYLNYRRYTLKNKCQNDIDIYNQEHPETPEVAFLVSGRPRFARTAVNEIYRKESCMIGMIRKDVKNWREQLSFQEDPGEHLKVFRKPEAGHRYVIGVDVAEGKMPEGCKKPDASVCQVLDKDQNCRQVAVLAGQISEENLVPYIDILGRWYNMAYLVIEINSGGIVIPARLMSVEFRYPMDRFFHIDDWKEGHISHRAAGWKTTAPTRRNLIADLAQFINERCLIVHEDETRIELDNFVWKGENLCEAQKGFHDDRVMALALACQGVIHYPSFAMSEAQRVAMFTGQTVQAQGMADY